MMRGDWCEPSTLEMGSKRPLSTLTLLEVNRMGAEVLQTCYRFGMAVGMICEDNPAGAEAIREALFDCAYVARIKNDAECAWGVCITSENRRWKPMCAEVVRMMKTLEGYADDGEEWKDGSSQVEDWE